MPVKKDDSGNRRVEMELLVPGTPEQVWHALATGQGNAGWFVKAEIEPRVGGSLKLDFGEAGTSAGEVTVWEPPLRFGYIEREWAPGAPPVATEITITSRSGDRCVVRMVHSLFASTDDWDDQLEGFEVGWQSFFAALRVYLVHFAGTNAASFMALGQGGDDLVSTWRTVSDALSLRGANIGEHRSHHDAPEAWAGVVEAVHQDATQCYVVVRLDEPSPGMLIVGVTAKDGAASVGLCRYCYGDRADTLAAAAEPAWRQWLNTMLPSPAAAVAGE